MYLNVDVGISAEKLSPNLCDEKERKKAVENIFQFSSSPHFVVLGRRRKAQKGFFIEQTHFLGRKAADV